MAQSQTTNPKPKGGNMYEKTIAKLVELAKQRNHGLSVPDEDQVARIRVYLARNGKVTFKELKKIPFQRCLFKRLAPLSDLLEIQLDTSQLQVSKDTPIEVAQYNRMKFERFLGRVVYNGRVFVPIGATGSLKKGIIWYGTSKVRDILHDFFKYAEATNYLGVLLSQSWVTEFTCDSVAVYHEQGLNDGMGYIRGSYAHSHGLHSQAQVRIVDIEHRSAAKGTLLPLSDHAFNRRFGNAGIAINQTLIKTNSQTFKSCVVSVRAVAKFSTMSSSFQVTQHITEQGISMLKPVISDKLDDVFARFRDKQKVVDEMRIRILEESGTLISDTKLAMMLLSNVPISHPWIQNRLSQLWLAELKELALGAGIEFHSGMAAYDPDLARGEVKFHNGSVFMAMEDLTEYLFGDTDGDLIPFVVNRETRECILTRYPIIQATGIIRAKVIGDIPSALSSNKVAVDVLSNHIHRLQHVSCPETAKKKTSLDCLVSVLLQGALGGSIGVSTLALAASVAHNKPDMTRELTLYSQEEVLGFKHNVNRCTRVQPGLVLSEHGTPAWYGVNPETLKDFKHISYPGIVTECWNYTADKTLEELSTMHESRRPLIEFKNLVPIPSSFTRREFVRVYQYYKLYCKKISEAMENADDESLNQVIKATEVIGSNLNDKEIAIAWHLSHMNGTGIGAFGIHLNINTLVRLLGYSEVNMPVIVQDDHGLLEKLELRAYNKQLSVVLRKFFQKKAA